MAKTPWLIKLVDSFDESICWSPPWWQPSTLPARLEWGNLDLPLVWGRSNIWTTFSIEKFERQQVRFLEETPFHLSSLDSCRCAGFLAAGSARSSKTPASRSLLRSSLTWKKLGFHFFDAFLCWQILTFYRTESDHWLCLSQWLTDSHLVNLIDETLACEDAHSELVEVVSVADNDDENQVGNSMLQIWKLRS